MASQLFTPITVRQLEIRNRLWVSPMCTYSCPDQDGLGSDWHLMHLGSFAAGGAGLVMTEATAVQPDGRISPQDLGLWSDDHIAPLKRANDLIHSFGTKSGIQLAHAGRKASTYWPWHEKAGQFVPENDGGWQTTAPTTEAFGTLPSPVAATPEYLDNLISSFQDAAVRAIEAGYDLIEIHAAHGYMIHSFLSPLSNTRTDEFGGNTAGRAELLLRIIRAIREKTSETPISVRFSGTDYLDGGLMPEEVATIAEMAAAAGADFVDMSSGGLQSGLRIEMFPGYQVDSARQVKASTGLLTSAVGLITQAVHAEELVASGAVDVVMAAREFLRNPHFAFQAARELGAGNAFTPPQYLRS